MFGSENKLVDAIEEGKIVRVSEDYAIREGLMILKKYEAPKADPVKMAEHMKISPRLKGERKIFADLDRYRRPLRNNNEVVSSLVDNFHWVLQSRRKQMNLSRRQVAIAVNSTEEDIKNLEVGVIPQNDYVLVNKLEDYYKINLRKSGDFSTSARGQIEKKDVHQPRWISKEIGKKSIEKATSDDLIVSSDIEIEKE